MEQRNSQNLLLNRNKETRGSKKTMSLGQSKTYLKNINSLYVKNGLSVNFISKQIQMWTRFEINDDLQQCCE